MAAEANRCPTCGAERPADAPGGVCPACQMRQTLAADAPPPAEIGAATIPADTRPDHATEVPDSEATLDRAAGQGTGAAPTATEITGDRTLDSDEPDRTVDGPGAASDDIPRGGIVRYFGDYEVQAELGRGGMGVVYKARQLSLNRPIALKMIKAGILADAAELRRFQNEAEAVALLDHAGIVPVYEVGEHDGQRYFSMKLVEGGNLADKLGAFADDPRGAATLMAEAAEAVHHAHMRGILHRDLKPANILIDAEGDPHVTDFGLAKRVESDVEMTASGAILGTPAYMSPEQASGHRGTITTATDVYGLGAILYALLTGRAPFVGDGVIETLEAVRSRAPESPRRLNARAPRDLETICLKCLEKDPRRRYASAQSMAEDLHAWLESRPIAARPVRASERVVLWCKRRPAIAALAAAVVVAVVAGTASVILVQARANRELARANGELAAEKARVQQRFELAQEAIEMFHKGVSEDVLLREKQFEALRTRLLRGAREFYRKLQGMLQGQPDRASRKALATTLIELADLTGKIENSVAESAILRDAVALLEALAREDPTDAEARRGLGRAWYLFGSRRGSSHGGLSEQRSAYRRADEILEPMARSEPPDVAARMALADVCLALASDLIDRRAGGEDHEAFALQTRARELLEGLARHDPANEKIRYELATSTGMAGVLLLELGHRREANEAYGRSLGLLEELFRAHPDDAEYARELTRVCGNLMIDLDQRDGPRTEERLALGGRAREVCERMAAVYPTLIAFRANKAWIDGIMAEILIDHDRDAEALPLLEEARSIRTDLIRSAPETLRFQETLSLILLDLRAVHARAGRFAEARAARAMSLEIQAGLARRNPDNPTMLNQQASWLTNSSDKIRHVDRPADAAFRAEEAGEGYRRAVAIREPLVKQHPDGRTYRCHLAYSLRRLALVERDLGDAAASAARTARAAALFEALPPREPFEWFELACCHAALSGIDGPGVSPGERLGHADRAMDLLRKAEALGYPDLTAYRQDPGLSAIRDRPDFRLLMMDLAMPSVPFAP
ncbi:MAG: protein kinase domain-containing protein [Isosphaeraceae bacterium]